MCWVYVHRSIIFLPFIIGTWGGLSKEVDAKRVNIGSTNPIETNTVTWWRWRRWWWQWWWGQCWLALSVRNGNRADDSKVGEENHADIKQRGKSQKSGWWCCCWWWWRVGLGQQKRSTCPLFSSVWVKWLFNWRDIPEMTPITHQMAFPHITKWNVAFNPKIPPSYKVVFQNCLRSKYEL